MKFKNFDKVMFTEMSNKVSAFVNANIHAMIALGAGVVGKVA